MSFMRRGNFCTSGWAGRGGVDAPEAPAPTHPSHCRRTLLTYIIDGAIAAAQEEEGAGCIITCDRLDLLDLGQERGSTNLAMFPHKVSLCRPCLGDIPTFHSAHFCVPSLVRLPGPEPTPSNLASGHLCNWPMHLPLCLSRTISLAPFFCLC